MRSARAGDWTQAQENNIFTVKLFLKVSELFKCVRSTGVFFKWMELMFDEFYKQGDMERRIELPVSKFMDRESTNREKIFVAYL